MISWWQKNTVIEKLKLQIQLELVMYLENLFPQEGLLSVIILLKSSIFPLTFMASSWVPESSRLSANAGEGVSFHKQAVIISFIDR